MSLWCTLLSAVPPITVGPDSATKATVVDAPIARVTVFEDRARVTRRATVAIPAGASVWRLPDIPASADIGALRATVSGGARLLRLEASPIERDQFPLEPAMKLLDQIDTMEDAVRRIDVERELLFAKAKLLAELMPAAAVPEAQREGRPAGGMFADLWMKTTAWLSGERTAIRAKISALDATRRTQSQAIADKRAEVARLGVDGAGETVVETVVVLESPRATSATVDLEYFVPGARWRPAYALKFFADAGKAELAAFGMVSQSTGEDWTNVELSLSTAIPSLGIEMPKLSTWTLGEAKEWRPTVYPRTAAVLPPGFPLPVPRPTALEEDREVDRALVLARIGASDGASNVSHDFSDQEISGGLERPKRQLYNARTRNAPGAPPPPPPPPPMVSAPAPVAQMDRQSVTIASESVSKSEPAPTRALELFEAPPREPMPVDPSSPAALAGGLDFVYVVPTKVTIAANGEAYRAPLGSETHPVSAFYEATPALAPEAYLRATVTNRSPRPILGGPVGIFLGSTFSGDGELATTGAGGTLALPLGGDEDVRVSRKLITTSETSGVFSKTRKTTYRVILEVASFKTKPITVVLREPLPKTGKDDVKVELVSSKAKPAAKGPDADGIMRWDVDVAPGKVQTIELVYRVEGPADWRLYQR